MEPHPPRLQKNLGATIASPGDFRHDGTIERDVSIRSHQGDLTGERGSGGAVSRERFPDHLPHPRQLLIKDNFLALFGDVWNVNNHAEF